MKLPKQLTKRQLVRIVEEIRDILYMDDNTPENIAKYQDHTRTKRFTRKLENEQSRRLGPDGSGLLDFLNPNKEWDTETISDVQQALDRRGLCPIRLMTLSEAYRKPTPDENREDDSIQFPRLLSCIGEFWRELEGKTEVTGPRTLAQIIGLPREKILEIFDRAAKEWKRVKKEAK
jgi:hypothetical protein